MKTGFPTLKLSELPKFIDSDSDISIQILKREPNYLIYKMPEQPAFLKYMIDSTFYKCLKYWYDGLNHNDENRLDYFKIMYSDDSRLIENKIIPRKKNKNKRIEKKWTKKYGKTISINKFKLFLVDDVIVCHTKLYKKLLKKNLIKGCDKNEI